MTSLSSTEDYLLPTLQEEGDGDGDSARTSIRTSARTTAVTDDSSKEKGTRNIDTFTTTSTNKNRKSNNNIDDNNNNDEDDSKNVIVQSYSNAPSSSNKSKITSNNTTSSGSGGGGGGSNDNISNTTTTTNNANNTNTNTPNDNDNAPSPSPNNRLGLSGIIRERSDSIRASVSRGRSSFASRYSSALSSASSGRSSVGFGVGATSSSNASARGFARFGRNASTATTASSDGVGVAAAVATTQAGRRSKNKYSNYIQNNNSSSNNGGGSIINIGGSNNNIGINRSSRTRSRHVYNAAVAIVQAARVYRGYKQDDYVLVMVVGDNTSNSNSNNGNSNINDNNTSTSDIKRKRSSAGAADVNVNINPTINHAGLVGASSSDFGTSESSSSNDGSSLPTKNNIDSYIPTAHLVNAYGYPKGQGIYPEERRKPYLYLLCKIKQVHYEENEVFWTLTRQDNGEEMRGDAGCMQPISTKEGLVAAQQAAENYFKQQQRQRRQQQQRRASEGSGSNGNSNSDDDYYNSRHLELDGDGDDNGKNNKVNRKNIVFCIVNCMCMVFCLPLFCLYECISVLKETVAFATMVSHATMFLNGVPPYKIGFRITTVNLIVLCSVWYLFVDQIRLAFFLTAYDDTLACINLFVWIVMVLELMFECFIRPEGWRNLIRSDQAWSPKTARYINNFHLYVESVSLFFFVHEFLCLFFKTQTCSNGFFFAFLDASTASVLGPTRLNALYGRLYYGVVRFRVFALVRHWRNWWVNITFVNERKYRKMKKRLRKKPRYIGDDRSSSLTFGIDQEEESSTRHVVAYGGDGYEQHQLQQEREETDRENSKAKASHIGTALMTVNSHRTLVMLCCLTAFFPILFLLNPSEVFNPSGQEMVDFLQAINSQQSIYFVGNESLGCDYLFQSIKDWMKADAYELVINLSIRPARCPERFHNTKIGKLTFYVENECPPWVWLDSDPSADSPDSGCIYGNVEKIPRGMTSKNEVAGNLKVRSGSIVTRQDSGKNVTRGVSASYDETRTVKTGARSYFVLQLLLVIFIIAYLQILRNDALKLVLGSLRSMLRIVARYAKNPLAQRRVNVYRGAKSSNASDAGSYDSGLYDEEEDQIVGNYETEQLVTTVSKITDLLRKCWGVAGADIISTNLASPNGDFEVFNPTVPGKNVFALFAFAAIKNFDHALKNLDGDVMILINDVAVVVHGDVYRWALGDSGQCNKNLGSSFVIVFKIGFVKEVVEKLEEATRVVFSTANGKKASAKKHYNRRSTASTISSGSSLTQTPNKNDRSRTAPNFVKGLKRKLHGNKTDVAMKAMGEAMQLSLKQIPGISAFADRAVIAMLKSFAGIHRDTQLRAWSRDFRLSAGVGTWSVDMIFGMDAGWAVEGAVGSEYKIDATYLSPHVNMASRMMSACKHYGVTILVSQAVQELLSEPGKKKMRNVDRVTVKGSSNIQNIYTYDARSKGADFFLYSVSDEQADRQAMNYEPNIWNKDPDLKAMRHHITEDFELEFMSGMKCYYNGDWPAAIEQFEKANEIMVEAAMEEHYSQELFEGDDPDRNDEASDQPCKYLINFMRSRGSKAPEDWDGWHPLLSK